MSEKNAQRQDRINTIVVGVVAGLLVGFILAMVLGAFSIGGKQDEGITNWLQGVSGVLSMLVSLYAARLLYKTVHATQRTLEVTQSIGDAQTRAWVYEADWRIYHDDKGPIVDIELRNFGNTPALHVLISGKYSYYSNTVGTGEEPILDGVGNSEAGFDLLKVLAPGVSTTFTTNAVEVDTESDIYRSLCIILSVEVSYNTVNSSTRIKHHFAIAIKEDNKEIVFDCDDVAYTSTSPVK